MAAKSKARARRMTRAEMCDRICVKLGITRCPKGTMTLTARELHLFLIWIETTFDIQRRRSQKISE